MDAPNPEFSRIVNLANLPEKGREEHLTSSAAERTALAKRFDLHDLGAFEATVTLTPSTENTVILTGTVTAHLSQRCVISLDPIETTLSIPLSLRLIPNTSPMNQEETLQHIEMTEDFEVIVHHKADLGELVAQQLGLALDPYPRKEGAVHLSSDTIPTPKTGLGALASIIKLRKNKD